MMALWPNRSQESRPGPKVTSPTFDALGGSVVSVTCRISRRPLYEVGFAERKAVSPRLPQAEKVAAMMRKHRTVRIEAEYKINVRNPESQTYRANGSSWQVTSFRTLSLAARSRTRVLHSTRCRAGSKQSR